MRWYLTFSFSHRSLLRYSVRCAGSVLKASSSSLRGYPLWEHRISHACLLSSTNFVIPPRYADTAPHERCGIFCPTLTHTWLRFANETAFHPPLHFQLEKPRLLSSNSPQLLPLTYFRVFVNFKFFVLLFCPANVRLEGLFLFPNKLPF